MKELETNIQEKESELIKSNYNKTIQTERDSLAEELYDLVNKQKRGHKLEVKLNGQNREKEEQNIFST